MSLEVGRVGVRPDQLDNYGRINPKSQFIQNLLNDLPAWTDLPVWKKGTEQLLPVNDDEPDTSPILCDIEYPVADLKNNQYFTYRQSPTQKDGKAKIRGIRGKTLVWNQIVQNGDFSGGTTNWSKGGGASAFSVSSGVCTVTAGKGWNCDVRQNISTKADHVYFGMFEAKSSDIDKELLLHPTGATTNTIVARGTLTSSFKFYSGIAKMADNASIFRVSLNDTASNHTGKTFEVRTVILIDLTLMFGAGKEPATVKDFTDLFPLPYYKYNAGSLLDFTGTKVKTTGKNLIPFPYYTSSKTENGLTFTVNDDGTILVNGTASSNTVFRLCTGIDLENGVNYILSGCPSGVSGISIQEHNGAPYDTGSGATFKGFINEGFRIRIASGTVCNKLLFKPMVRYASADSDYEVYKSNETELPISTFFPTGMKSAGAVYDELTPTRAITRVGQVDLGATQTSDWTKSGGVTNCFILTNLSYIKGVPSSTVGNLTCNAFATKSYDNLYAGDDGISNRSSSGKGIAIKSSALSTYYSNNDIAGLITYLKGVKVNYELAVEDVQPTISFGD